MLSLLCFKKKIKNLKLVFVKTDFRSKRFVNFAKNKANLLNLPLEIIGLKLPESVLENNKNKCYFCKNAIFSKIKKEFAQEKYIVIDGTNYSDIFEHRPGIKALEEHKIKSPFKELKITKKDIIAYLQKENLYEFISLPTTCLGTRIKFNKKINKEILEKIDIGEKFLETNGVEFSRLRLIDEKTFVIETIDEYFSLITPVIIEKLKNKINADKIF